MRLGIAFDATGVIYKSRRAIPRAKEAFELLKQRNVPFVILTNASDPKRSERAKFLNAMMGAEILEAKHIIMSHTPIKMMCQEINEEPWVSLVGGGV